MRTTKGACKKQYHKRSQRNVYDIFDCVLYFKINDNNDYIIFIFEHVQLVWYIK